MSGSASQLCLRALGNMGPRIDLPDGMAEDVVRPWCRSERPGRCGGGPGMLAAALGGDESESRPGRVPDERGGS